MKKVIVSFCSLFYVQFLPAQLVGINTPTPRMQLEINAPDSAVLLLQNQQASAPNVKSGIFFRSGSRYLGSVAGVATSTLDGKLAFSTFSTASPNDLKERLTITDGGNVGINVTEPTQTLDVDGGLRIRGNTASGNVLTGNAEGVASWQKLPATNSAFYALITQQFNLGAIGMLTVPFRSNASGATWDDGSSYNNATYGFVAPENGVYHFDVGVHLLATAANPFFISLGLNKNNLVELVSVDRKLVAGSTAESITASATVKLLKNDIIRVQFYQNSGDVNFARLASCNSCTYFTGYRVY